ncbi:MAG: protease modulator HflC [Deltaproteobacteria bacterium]|nr:protease modulator HflC [Deltaproteobacteria bacterium]MBW1964005.1 protease modulator HflC [Deltaproteobacteria bacterium]MBW2080057.1 protease modulator HflC [Deltaproteobacteria bacterium]
MKYISTFAIIVIIIAVSVVGGVFFIVDETQQAIVTQFGKPVGTPITTPGLHMKLPFIQNTNYFDKRFLAWDGDPNQIPTKDKRFIWVDTYARWHITDSLLFFQRLRDERGAYSRLDDILDGETRNAIAKHVLIELVRSTNPGDNNETKEDMGSLKPIKFGREKLEQEVLRAASPRVTDLGIEILDFKFKRINYVEEVRREVYARMISERKRIAEQYRSEGAGESARISGEKDRELKTITSEAYRKTQEIRGKANSKAADIYATAYNKDPEFYRFTRTMESFTKIMDENTTLVMSTDGDLFKYLKGVK